jgi:hypothetical protein
VVHVTPRDLAILRAIGRMKRASLRQIHKLFFGDDRTAARRMATLFAGGYVEVRVPALHEQNLLSLTSKGRALLIATATAEVRIPAHLGACSGWDLGGDSGGSGHAIGAKRRVCPDRSEATS